ncbi:MAG: hypothetical protein LBN23_03545 [Paludibacter sp.]|jgi:hypothetical protein|nr:hypothetical protein [Paludibacter sp.]
MEPIFSKKDKKLTFFQMMYCCMFVYIYKLNLKREEPAFLSCTLLSALRMFNLLSVFGFIIMFFLLDFKNISTGIIIISMLIVFASIFIVDEYLFYKKQDIIFEKYNMCSPKEKRTGKFYYWLYVAFTLLTIFGLLPCLQGAFK